MDHGERRVRDEELLAGRAVDHAHAHGLRAGGRRDERQRGRGRGERGACAAHQRDLDQKSTVPHAAPVPLYAVGVWASPR